MNTDGVIQAGSVEIDLVRSIVTRDANEVALTPMEWRLLRHFADNAGRVVTSVELLTSIWGPAHRSNVQYLRIWVSRLRRKVEPVPAAPVLIKTMQGMGYMFDPDGADANP